KTPSRKQTSKPSPADRRKASKAAATTSKAARPARAAAAKTRAPAARAKRRSKGRTRHEKAIAALLRVPATDYDAVQRIIEAEADIADGVAALRLA
ncbi:hypothetical protein ABTM57_19440, partial [Acinetobacter baumannii]